MDEYPYNLKGFIVGNGVTDYELDMRRSFAEAAYNYKMIPKSLLDTILLNDCHFYWKNVHNNTDTEVC